MRFTTVKYGLIVVAGLALVSCSKSATPEGRWKSEDETQLLEFLKSGELFWTRTDGINAGRWEIVEKGRVKLSFAQDPDPTSNAACEFTITKDVLDIPDPCRVRGKFTRQKDEAASS